MAPAAAGAQNALLRSQGAARLGTTFVTGTLYAAGNDLALALRGLAPPMRCLQHLSVWGALLAGAGLGAAVYTHFDIYALWLPLAFYILLLIAFLPGLWT